MKLARPHRCVAPADADVVYLGMGEGQLRSNVMQDDCGESLRHIGLADFRVISTIRVHPDDPEVVYVAALGDFWLPQAVRFAKMEILDERGRLVRTVFSREHLEAGPHRATWDLRHEGAVIFAA